MRQLDVYFHAGCLSEQAIILLAHDIARECPTWTVSLHPLIGHEAMELGFSALPAIVLNGRATATGIPQKDWLIRKMRECEATER